MSDDIDKSKVGIVVYTDGGTRPNPGYGGYGAHGYIYSYSEPTKQYKYTTMRPNVKTTVDGYNKNSNKIVRPFCYFDIYGSIGYAATSNSSELLAVIEFLESLYNKKLGIHHKQVKTLLILADSIYVINILLSMLDKTYNIKTVTLNKDLCRILLKWVKKIIKSNIDVTVKHVKGHSNNLGNDIADMLAGTGICLSINNKDNFTPQKEVLLEDGNKYWDKEEPHPLLFLKKMIFNLKEEDPKDENIYYMSTYESNAVVKEYGKIASKTVYAIAELPEPISALTILKDKLRKINNRNSIGYILLHTLFNPFLYKYLNKLSFKPTYPFRLGRKLFFHDQQLLGGAVINGALIIKSSSYLDKLYTILDDFHTDKRFIYKDITEHFYEQPNAKLKSNLNTDKTVLVTEVVDKYTLSFNLILGADTLPKNVLKKVEDNKPRMWLCIVREGDAGYSYYTLLETNIGKLIMAQFFSNIVVPF